MRGIRLVDGNSRFVDINNGPDAKNCAGYGALYTPVNVAVGSEGTLGIITRVELSLTLPPPESFLAIVFFPDAADLHLTFCLAYIPFNCIIACFTSFAGPTVEWFAGLAVGSTAAYLFD